jgi:hypothetical protein
MGFWHTGYIEFHEPVGLDAMFEPASPHYPCVHCDESFATLEELRKHRFEAHPLNRPVMFLHGRELGTQPVRITRQLSPADVRIEVCNRAVLNGVEVPISNLPRALAGISSDVCRVVLSKSGVDAEFELEFRVASEMDLVGVEEQFKRTAIGRRLDTRAVDEFISAASDFRSAIGYCDGICAYLYGVLAKERAPDSSLSYEAYRGKFSAAAEELADYDRPLARTIGSLIEFHFNHFRESAVRLPHSRVGRVAGRYADWIESRSQAPKMFAVEDTPVSHLEALVTDWETEKIVLWGIRPLPDLSKDVDDIELFLKRDLAEFDRVKLHILLGELLAASGEKRRAREHAKALRNLAALEHWAETLLQALSEDNDDRA